MRAVADPAPSPLTAMFNGIDTDHNGSLTSAEVKAMVNRARVNPIVSNAVTQKLMESFDTDHSGQVSTAEFRANIKEVLFHYVRDTNGRSPDLSQLSRVSDEWFTRADADHNDKLTPAEAKPVLLAEIERDGQDNAELRADAASKIGIYLYDRDGNRTAERQELRDVVAEILDANRR